MMKPIEMKYEDKLSNTSFNVFVYQFVHISLDEVYALCWNNKSEVWLTVPVHMLTPIIRKDLSE